jgi:hypothetical protein
MRNDQITELGNPRHGLHHALARPRLPNKRSQLGKQSETIASGPASLGLVAMRDARAHAREGSRLLSGRVAVELL